MERQYWIVLGFFVATLGLLSWAFDWTGMSMLPRHLKEKPKSIQRVDPHPEPEAVMSCEEVLKQNIATLEIQDVNFNSTRVNFIFTSKTNKKISARMEPAWIIWPMDQDLRHTWITLEVTQQPLPPQAISSVQILSARWAPLNETVKIPPIGSVGESTLSSGMEAGNFKLSLLGSDKPIKRLLDQANEVKPLPDWEVLQIAVWILTIDVDLETVRNTIFTKPRGQDPGSGGSAAKLFTSMTQIDEALEWIKAAGVNPQTTKIFQEMEAMLVKAMEDFRKGENVLQALETIGLFASDDRARTFLLQVINERTSDEDKLLRSTAYKALCKVFTKRKGSQQVWDDELWIILTHFASIEKDERNKRVIHSGLMDAKRAMEGLFKEAAKKGDVAAIDIWVAKGVDVNAGDGEALAYAAQGDHLDAVKMLIKNGGNPGLKWGADAFLRSAEKSNTEMMRLLLEKGADRYVSGEIGGRALWWSARNGNAAMIQLLLDKGVHVNSGLDVENSTPLMQAVQNNRVDCVELLIHKGADVNAINLFGKSVLKLAKERNHSAVIKLLKKAGANE